MLFRSGADAPFVMELPPYRAPMVKSLIIHMWDRSKIFLRKISGIILLGSIIVWGLSTFPRNVEYSINYNEIKDSIVAKYEKRIQDADIKEKALLKNRRDKEILSLNIKQNLEKREKSFMGRIGKAIGPFFSPIGIEWQGGVALLTGFVAKEIVVSTMGVLYSAEQDDPEALKKALVSSGMSPISALSMMVFVLLYVPCLATVATIRRETGGIKWTLFSIIYSTSLAWVIAFIVYQTGSITGIG